MNYLRMNKHDQVFQPADEDDALVEEVVHQGVAEEEEDHHMETVEEEDQHVEIGEKVEDNHQYKPIMPKENQLKRKKKSRKIRVLKLKMAFHSTLPSKMVLMFMNLKN